MSRGRGRGCGKERRKEGARGGEGGIMSARRMADINRDREAAGAGSGDTVYIHYPARPRCGHTFVSSSHDGVYTEDIYGVHLKYLEVT